MNVYRKVLASFASLRRSPSGSDHNAAYRCLLENASFRLSQSEANDPLVGFRILVRSLKRLASTPFGVNKIPSGDPGVAMIDSNSRTAEQDLNYVSGNTSNTPGYYLEKESLPSQLNNKVGMFLRHLLFGLPVAIQCLLNSSHRGNRALSIHFVLENAALLAFCRQQGIRELIHFAPYLIDANWQYLLLHEAGIRVTKVPSPGPLATHHHILLTDRLIVSSYYQVEELNLLQHHIRYTERELWHPESAHTYMDNYKGKDPAPPSGTLGFYSHASWLRALQGHADNGANIQQNEEWVLEQLNAYLALHPEVHLLVFTHPRERADDVIERTRAYYNERLGNDRWSFAPFETPSSHAFDSVDVGVAALSTIIFERLFCGYKTLIGNAFSIDFPAEGSTLQNLCFNHERKLDTLLDQALSAETAAFFEATHTQPYIYRNYPETPSDSAVNSKT